MSYHAFHDGVFALRGTDRYVFDYFFVFKSLSLIRALSERLPYASSTWIPSVEGTPRMLLFISKFLLLPLLQYISIFTQVTASPLLSFPFFPFFSFVHH